MTFFARVWLSNGDSSHDNFYHFKKDFPEDASDKEVDEYFQNLYQNLYDAFFKIYDKPKEDCSYSGWRYISESEYEMLK